LSRVSVQASTTPSSQAAPPERELVLPPREPEPALASGPGLASLPLPLVADAEFPARVAVNQHSQPQSHSPSTPREQAQSPLT
jgi:hypothetical protein